MARMRMTPGQMVEFEVDPAAWPYRVRVGQVEVKAWPSKYRDEQGRIAARVEFRIPFEARPGERVTLSDATGKTVLGSVISR